MEFDQIKDGLEDHLADSKKKIEHLTTMVQTLTDTKKNSNGNDVLKRIEAKLDVIAESDSGSYIDLLLESLKAELEEKQNVLDLKITSVKELTNQITDLLKNQSMPKVLGQELNTLKSEIDDLTREVLELNKNSQQTNSIICNISDKDSLEYLKSAIDSLDLNINTTLSALSILDLKVKTISENLEKVSSLDNISLIKDEVIALSEKISTLSGSTPDNQFKDQINDLIPVIQNVEQIKDKINSLETILSAVKDNFEPKLTKVQDDFYIFQDKINVSLSSLIKPLNDELFHLNEKILDLKEYFTFQKNNDDKNKGDLAVIAERFNDIWTSAGLTIDKLAEQVVVTEESTDKFQNTVNNFFEISEDTNLIITNLLKKSTEISANLDEIKNIFLSKIDNLTGNLNIESQRICESFKQGNVDILDRVEFLIEGNFNFLRTDVIEFKDKQERILEDTLANQESIQNSLSNLHFAVTDSGDSVAKKISELVPVFDKLDNTSLTVLSATDIIKESLVQIAGWIDSVESVFIETNDNVKEIKKSNELKKILTELTGLKENMLKSSNNLGSSYARIENTLLDTKEELRSSLNVIKKRQECDFDSINTNISCIAHEIINVNQAFTTFENKVKQDLKLLNNSMSEKLDSQKDVDLYPINKLEVTLDQVKKDINLELRKINDKFSKLEMNLGNINEKLYEIEHNRPVDNNEEIKQMLESVMSQLSTINNNNSGGGGILLKKINSLESRMAEFDSSMKKIVNFIDAE